MITTRGENTVIVSRSRPSGYAADGTALRATMRGTPTAQIITPDQRAAARAKRKAQRQARKRSR